MMLAIFYYLLIGAVAGILSGLLGLGGGVIIIPSLVLLFVHITNFPVADVFHLAIGTSLASIVIVAIISMLSYLHQAQISWSLARRLLPGLLVGAAVGGVITNFLPGHWLRVFFALFLFVVAIWSFLQTTKKTDEAPSSTLPNHGIMFIISWLIGLISGMLGVGIGSTTVPFLLHHKVAVRTATATVVACTVPTALVGSIAYLLENYQGAVEPYTLGYVYLPALAGISIASILFAPLGVFLALHLPTKLLKRIFAVFLVGLSILLLFRG